MSKTLATPNFPKCTSACPGSSKSAKTVRPSRYGPPSWPEAVAQASKTASVRRQARQILSDCEVIGLEPEDLLHQACVRALSHPPAPCAAGARLVNCMRSIASSAKRDQLKRKQQTENANDEIFPRHGRSLQPDESIQRAWTQNVILRCFDEVAANDDAVGRLIDVVCDGYRGKMAQKRLAYTALEYETVKKRTQRHVRQKFKPYLVNGDLQFDWLQTQPFDASGPR